MKFLLAEDDDGSRLALRTLLEEFGEVHEARDAFEAWQLLRSGMRFDACCSDVRMPRGGGLALLERVRSDIVLAQLPFVLITSAADRETVTAAARHGVCGYLLKPYAPEAVRATIERVLRVEESRRADTRVVAP